MDRGAGRQRVGHNSVTEHTQTTQNFKGSEAITNTVFLED